MNYKLIYTSTAVNSLTDQDMESILNVARTENPKCNISGVLLFFEGDFIQVLEGNRKDVTALFDKIKQDARHQEVELLFEEFQEERVFGDWSMAYLPLDKDTARAMCGNMDVTSVDQMAEVLKHPSRILQQFFKGMLGEMAKAAINRKAALDSHPA